MSVSFVPAIEEDLHHAFFGGVGIKVLIIDESGPGVEIRIMTDGSVTSRPLDQGVEHFRNSFLWAELK